jgi:hypothetical protein
MYQTSAVEIGQCVQGWSEQVVCLCRSQWPLGKDLREVLWGVLRGNEEKLRAAQLATSTTEEPYQVRMGQWSSQVPLIELAGRGGRVGRNQFEGGLLASPLTVFNEKHGAVFGAAHVLVQAEFRVDNLALPLFPGLGHLFCQPPPIS